MSIKEETVKAIQKAAEMLYASFRAKPVDRMDVEYDYNITKVDVNDTCTIFRYQLYRKRGGFDYRFLTNNAGQFNAHLEILKKSPYSLYKKVAPKLYRNIFTKDLSDSLFRLGPPTVEIKLDGSDDSIGVAISGETIPVPLFILDALFSMDIKEYTQLDMLIITKLMKLFRRFIPRFVNNLNSISAISLINKHMHEISHALMFGMCRNKDTITAKVGRYKIIAGFEYTSDAATLSVLLINVVPVENYRLTLPQELWKIILPDYYPTLAEIYTK